MDTFPFLMCILYDDFLHLWSCINWNPLFWFLGATPFISDLFSKFPYWGIRSPSCESKSDVISFILPHVGPLILFTLSFLTEPCWNSSSTNLTNEYSNKMVRLSPSFCVVQFKDDFIFGKYLTLVGIMMCRNMVAKIGELCFTNVNSICLSLLL